MQLVKTKNVKSIVETLEASISDFIQVVDNTPASKRQRRRWMSSRI